MGNLFRKIAANSKETAQQLKGSKEESVVETKICPQCGAPRPFATNLAVCAYCGYQFMDAEINIKSERS